MGDALANWFAGMFLAVGVLSAAGAIALWELGWYLWRHVGFTWG